ncbi:MAG: dicarboxylate/amino acid:cation symporter [Spirochaetaceae bacterium]
MKIWMRLLAGSIIGVLLGSYLPESGGDTARFFADITEYVVSIARYFLFPLVFFGVVIGTSELMAERRVLRLYAKTIGLLLAATAVSILIGTGAVLAVSPGRIPPIFQEAPMPDIPELDTLLERVFPRNLFAVFSQGGDYLLPLLALGLFIGLALHYDQSAGHGVSQFADSASRVFYRLSAFVVEILGIGMIAVAAALVFEIRSINDFQIFGSLVLTVSVSVGFIVLVVYPVIIYFLIDRDGALPWLYAMIAPLLTGLFSGDVYFSLPTLERVGKESLGVPRRAGSAVFSLAAVFGKAGSALVAAASFIVILRSYTALEITFAQVLWVMTSTFGVSFLLGAVPGSAAIVALAMLSNLYGRGMEEVFLILWPAAPILISLGVVLDVATAGFVAQVVASTEKIRRRVDQFDFI